MSKREEKKSGVARHIIIEGRTPDEFQRKLDEAVARGALFFPESFQHIWIPQVSGRVYLGIVKYPQDTT
ncbi:MAG: hypothetical protein OXH73_04015 [Caldilineaceae bacterium]|nr:hypothetical protein [Caldilineaceae bacterium]